MPPPKAMASEIVWQGKKGSTARNMPASISDYPHLARAQLERFDLKSAVAEYRDILLADHRRRLAGGLVEPPRAENLRKSPMAAVPKPRRRSHLRMQRAASEPQGNFLQIPADVTNVKGPGSHLFRESFVPLPLHCTYS
mmetsp:Transcript_58184/g.108946  ORF Transcript_58184/g.108946 Transcript_58184/m.108946 type:complete len:139 (-) Transcript_58184:67-483(-)